MSTRLTCADVEILLADYLDQLLLDAEAGEVKAHLGTCAACAELAADAAAAMALMDRAAIVEPPPELINKILFEVTSGPSRVVVKAPLAQRLFGKWLQPVLQPRFAMGMAMTMLSLGMLLRMSGVRQWTDLNPVNVYAAAEDHVTRLWDRGVKNYQSLKLVYEIQTRYQEWAAEQDRARERDRENGDKGGEKQ
ncbi:MAG: hypothetical protein RL328_495 [Acidobacteriota bacterium]|jgi:hypothetical protein